MADKPLVGVVMGSDSDLATMQKCVDQLASFGIACEVRIISAHRTPEAAHEYAATAVDRGLKVVIAAAGMSAALAGVLAAKTTLPVIGVPMDSGPLKGIDAALSTMQMPPGVPVGCMSMARPVRPTPPSSPRRSSPSPTRPSPPNSPTSRRTRPARSWSRTPSSKRANSDIRYSICDMRYRTAGCHGRGVAVPA